jgi:hypothetical protein
MSTQGVVVQTSWINITTEFSLTDGQVYSVQNTGSVVIQLTEQTTTPDDASPRHDILPGLSFTLEQASTLNFYVKAEKFSSYLTVTEG